MSKPATTPLPTPMPFPAGTKVRLAAAYHGKSLASTMAMGLWADRKAVMLPLGTEFTVALRGKTSYRRDDVAGRLDGPTVIVKNADGTWCIPARLLEAVPASDASEQGQETSQQSQLQPQPKESGCDTQGDRIA